MACAGWEQDLRLSVCGVVDPIVQRHRLQKEGVDAFQAANVVAVLVREGAALVVGVDAAV